MRFVRARGRVEGGVEDGEARALVGRGVAPPRARELDARRRLEGDEVKVAREAVGGGFAWAAPRLKARKRPKPSLAPPTPPPEARSARRRGARRGARRGPGGLGEFLREERVGGRLGGEAEARGAGRAPLFGAFGEGASGEACVRQRWRRRTDVHWTPL